MAKKPSQRLEDVLMGRVPLENEDESIQSWASFFIHQGAEAVLRKPTKEARQEALRKLPAKIRPHVEARALTLWNRSKGR